MKVTHTATPWIAEDDVLLRNAIESGASLEALAKGAVRFSRKFTLREIRERWRSLLYDPCESVRASIHMSELEKSIASHGGKLGKFASIKESGRNATKRKSESVRRKYYAMRKRIRQQHIDDDDDFDYFGTPKINGHANQGLYGYPLQADPLAANDNYLLEDHTITNPGRLELGKESMRPVEPAGDNNKLITENVNMKMLPIYDLMYSDAEDASPEFRKQEPQFFNSPLSDSHASREPLWKMTEDVSASMLPISVNSLDKSQGEKNHPNITDVDHDCLLNAANDGSLLYMDVDGSASADKSCYDNVNFLLLSSPIYTHDESVPNDITKDADAVPALATSVVRLSSTLDITTNPPESGIGTNNNVSLDGVVSSLLSTQKSQCSEIQELDTPCIINTEAEEVPNNDDIFPIGVITAKQTSSLKTNGVAPTDDVQQGNVAVLAMKVGNPSQPVIVLGARPVKSLQAYSNNATKPSMKAPEFPATSALVGKHAKNGQIVPDNRKSARSTGSASVSDLIGKAGTADFKKLDAPDLKLGELTSPEQMSEPSSSGEDEFESDEDVPCFSDVESMVLEMDLCAHDQDPFTCTRVSRYHDEAARRQIVRLEQCARSYMDRRIESHGAFAIFYGRRLKHYIKKPEVILGRATEDMEVDVDLTREGRASKISRHQATIKLEADGSFTITNFGKFSILVNGRELATGRFMTLTISNLIEIRGMGFIFEASNKSVQRFLASRVSLGVKPSKED